MDQLPEYVDGLPNISGSEGLIDEAIGSAGQAPVFWRGGTGDPFAGIDSACAIALHMHQPLIPAGGDDLRSARLISNLQYMQEHPDIGDNHNASVFRWCYKRMGEFIPQLIGEGLQPRVMLEYSGTLAARPATDGRRRRARRAADDHLRSAVSLGGGVARLPVGTCRRSVDARAGLSPARPGVAAPLRRAVRARGAGLACAGSRPPRWRCPTTRTSPTTSCARCSTAATAGCSCRSTPSSSRMAPVCERKHLPHRLACTNSSGETASIVAIVKTQGSDTKLVAQMQPYYEAQGPWPLGAGRAHGAPARDVRSPTGRTAA